MFKLCSFFIGIKFRKMETMIKIFRDYGHIQLHFKALAKIYSFKVIKVICTIPQFQLGYIYYKRCASAETTLQLK